jgi:S-disulfanyl-L-cysteine oxidoreductase SoxD
LELTVKAWRITLVIACAVVAGFVSCLALYAQQEAKARQTTTKDGVYSTAQAASGQAVYTKNCSSCHLDSLTGGMNESPALKGDQFISDWNGKPLRELYSRILTTMPQDDPGSLSDQEALDVLAYILQQNGYAAGQKALGPPDALDKIQFVKAERAGAE